jgi:ribonuclease BN (tRNA processing enzyme)
VLEAWEGRQIALGRGAEWIGLGEIVAAAADTLDVRIVGSGEGADRLLVRNASRGPGRQLRTARAVKPRAPRVKQATRKGLEVQCGSVLADLVNGVTGDPLLLLRLRHRRGALLFDVGESASLSRRLLHTVTDLFLTHAHLDHIAGFPYLLRSRLSAPLPPLRVYGPPGTRAHVEGFLAGVCWDRIGADGPAFEIVEVYDSHLERSRLQAGGRTARDVVTAPFDTILLRTGDFTVRAARLDHRIPVLAFALEVAEQQSVVPAALAEHRLKPGPWIGELKANVQQGLWERHVTLPDASSEPTDALAAKLLRTRAGPKVVYATDFADHAVNRATLTKLARGAQLLFCESTFRNADADLATATQHLTARACGEIAAAARVERLVPFHFSKRYEGRLADVYAEIREAARGVDLVHHREL